LQKTKSFLTLPPRTTEKVYLTGRKGVQKSKNIGRKTGDAAVKLAVIFCLRYTFIENIEKVER